MNKLFAVVCLAMLASVTMGTRLRAKSTYEIPEISAIEKSKWGAQLLDTVALQIQSKAPLDKINALLQEIVDDLDRQQTDDDNQYAIDMLWCKDEKKRLNTDITNAKAAVVVAENKIAKRTKAIKEGVALESKLVKQIDTLESHIQHTHDERKKDSEDFAKRDTETNIAIDAIADAITEVQQLVGRVPAPIESAIQKL